MKRNFTSFKNKFSKSPRTIYKIMNLKKFKIINLCDLVSAELSPNSIKTFDLFSWTKVYYTKILASLFSLVPLLPHISLSQW